jgi:Ala-tRNA(Pro) deacylase
MYAHSFFHTPLRRYLKLNNVPYKHHIHDPVYTARELAAQENVPATIVAKAVVVKADHRYVMAVVPASSQVDFPALAKAADAKDLRLAAESELQELFPDADVGGMPPFGNLYGLAVFVDESLSREPEIVFNAGNHDETIRLKYADFARLVKPTTYDNRDLLAVLKSELAFVQNVGYHDSYWRPHFVFEDSSSCPNNKRTENFLPCKECVLIDLVPPEHRGEHFPCRHIPLTATGKTIDDFYQSDTEKEIGAALEPWLRKTIYRLQFERASKQARELTPVEQCASEGPQSPGPQYSPAQAAALEEGATK